VVIVACCKILRMYDRLQHKAACANSVDESNPDESCALHNPRSIAKPSQSRGITPLGSARRPLQHTSL
jgi:hypothetical protein